MKRIFIIITLMFLAVLAVSCKCQKSSEKTETVKSEEAVVDATKAVLADDVLALLNDYAEDFIANFVEIHPVFTANLTPDEKLVRPDWFLDPAKLNELVTKSQKVNALAILLVDRPIMENLGIPTQEHDKVIGRLLSELNNPFNFDDVQNMSIAEKIQKNFEICKERGETQYVWNFALAAQNELMFIISRNPKAFLDNITEEDYQKVYKRYYNCVQAAVALAPYDKEIAQALEICKDEENFIDDALFHTLEDAKVSFVTKKSTFESRRNALLK